MASIRKRQGKHGVSYQLLYRDRKGVQTSETFARRRDAERRKSEVEVEVRQGTYVPPKDGRIKFGDWYAIWEPTRRVSATREATDRGRRDKYVLARWRDVPLDSITYMDAEAWVAELSSKMKPASVAACFRLLKLPLDAAVKDGRLRANPVQGVKLPRVPTAAKTADEVLTPSELARVVAAFPDRWKALVVVLGWLGLRWSEALGLRRCDFNPFRKELYVGRVTVVEPDCRTLLIKEGGKSEHAERTVPLPEAAVTVLLDHIADYCPDAKPDDFLFVTTAGTAPRRSNFRRMFNKALHEAGVDRKITIHGLRHTAASLMLDAGVLLHDASRRLGHSRPSTTYDMYTHLLTSQQEAGTAALDAAMRTAAGE